MDLSRPLPLSNKSTPSIERPSQLFKREIYRQTEKEKCRLEAKGDVLGREKESSIERRRVPCNPRIRVPFFRFSSLFFLHSPVLSNVRIFLSLHGSEEQRPRRQRLFPNSVSAGAFLLFLKKINFCF